MQARWRTIAVNLSALLAAALALFGAATLASAGGTKTISVKASTLTDNKGPTSQGGCIAGGGSVTLWHFIINGLDGGTAPASISVTWDTPATETVPLDKVSGPVAHYSTTLHAGSRVTNATAVVPSDWSGQFNLSHVECGEPPAKTSSIVTTVKRDVDGVPTEVSNALPAPVGATVYDTAVVDTTPTGATLPTGSTVEFSFFANNTCEGTASATASLDAGGKTTAANVGPALSQVIATEGGYSYIANFVSGDVSKVLSSKGACEPFLAEAEPPAEALPSSVVTTVKRDVDGVPTEVSNALPAPVGATVYDTAVVDTTPTGATLPTGSTVEFSFFANNTCEGTASATASLDAGGKTTAANVGPALSQVIATEGGYSYIANFVSGDVSKVLSSKGACEPFLAEAEPPAEALPSSIVTTVKRDVDGVPTEVSNALPAPVGATVYDTAVVDTTPTGATLPTGSTVQFNFFTNNTCEGTPIATTDIDVGGQTTAANVGPALSQVIATEGGYSYIADFVSGDVALVLDSAGACEPFLVESSPPAEALPSSIVTTVKRDVDGVPTEVSNALPAPVGATVYDTAVLDTVPTGTTLPTGSNVQFSFYMNNTCEGFPVVIGSIGVGGQTAATNVGPALPQSSLAAGGYSYKANFVSGDISVVLDSMGACEPFTVSGGSTTESSTPGSNGGTADGTSPTAYLFLDPATPPEGAGTFPPLGSPNYQSDPELAICNKPVLTPEEQAYCFTGRG